MSLIEANQESDLAAKLTAKTGLEFINATVFPELTDPVSQVDYALYPTFTFSALIGDKVHPYSVELQVQFTDQWTPGELFPEISWQIHHDDELVYAKNGMVNTSFSFQRNEERRTDKVTEYLEDALKHELGGPDPEVAFMDYEKYSVQSLQNNNIDSYFANIYLVIMAHMKERGLPMPPILSRSPQILEALRRGDVEAIQRMAATIKLVDARQYDRRCQAHIDAELAIIKQWTLEEHNKRNPVIPIEEAFPGTQVITLDGKAESSFHPYTILVVENDLRNFGGFTSLVQDSLEKDERYKKTKLIPEFNLASCMDICRTGRIDMIVFDWTNPSPGEMLMIRKEENPLYSLYYGDSQAAIYIGEEGLEVTVPSGEHLTREELEKQGSDIDMRHAWMNKIAAACEKEGIVPPPHFIIRSETEWQDIAKIISQRLGNSIS